MKIPNITEIACKCGCVVYSIPLPGTREELIDHIKNTVFEECYIKNCVHGYIHPRTGTFMDLKRTKRCIDKGECQFKMECEYVIK